MVSTPYLCKVNLITRHIEYLILRHDCVVIPGFGAIIANYRAARIDAELGCMFPPSRTIGFNPAVDHNDGLLASSIARGEDTSIDNAASIISREVAMLKMQLDNTGEYPLGRLGIFSRCDNGPVIFEPFAGTTLSTRLAGLRAIALTPITEMVKQEAWEEKKRATIPARRRIVNIAASIAVLLFFGTTLTTPIIEHGADFAGFSSHTCTAVAEEMQFVPVKQPCIDLSIAFPVIKEETPSMLKPEEAVAETATKPEPGIRLNPADRYFLVVASLPSRAKAEEYISATRRGKDSFGILESDGRYRVYAATGNSVSQAKEILYTDTTSASRYPGAWVCRR